MGYWKESLARILSLWNTRISHMLTSSWYLIFKEKTCTNFVSLKYTNSHMLKSSWYLIIYPRLSGIPYSAQYVGEKEGRFYFFFILLSNVLGDMNVCQSYVPFISLLNTLARVDFTGSCIKGTSSRSNWINTFDKYHRNAFHLQYQISWRVTKFRPGPPFTNMV